MINTKNKRIVIIAIFSSLFYLLSVYGTIKINNNVKFTFQNLTIFLASILFGETIGLLVGTLGMFLSQLFSEYGITITTALWILPYTVAGFLAGFLYKKFKNKLNNYVNIYVYIYCINIVITILNTFALYIDSKIFGYYNDYLIFGSIFMRIVNVFIISFIYTLVIPLLIKTLKKINYLN